ncbi:MAG: alpha/beta hydrolase [Thermosynechococcaceae cyanobacterium]
MNRMRVKQTLWTRLLWWGCLSGCSFTLSCTVPSVVTAAERVYANYGFIELAIPVTDLELYATTGRLSPTLRTYAKYLKPAQLQNLREALKTRIDLSPQVVSQFLYTPTGEKLLERASVFIKNKSPGSSIQALRSAIILASNHPDGLTVLSMLRSYPESSIQLDVATGIGVFQGIRRLVQQTNTAIALVQQQAETSARSEKIAPWSDLIALQKPGPFAWEVVPLSLTDARPQRVELTGQVRQYAADIYVPKSQGRSLPLIVISHGLGSGRTTFRYFAEHLASHGYVVAVPEHPGSSSRQFEALLDGKANDVSPPSEFIDRPLDVSFLLDELSRLNQTDTRLSQRLNLKRVGIMGQSFGGYTALALGGAQLNIPRLEQACGPQLSKSLNLSLLLQCQVLQLPRKTYDFRDPRISAAIAVNPIGGSIFGPEGLKSVQIPIMMVAGSADTIAPPLAEQIEPFTELPSIEKWLILMDGATHFSTLDDVQPGERVFITPKELIGPTPKVARTYIKSLGLAFFQAFVENQSNAERLLNAASIQAMSTAPIALRGVENLMPEDLERMKNAL